MQYGYVKVAAAAPFVKVADCDYNTQRIQLMIEKADARGVEILVFPELSITGYTCGDLFLQPFLLESAERALVKLVADTAKTKVVAIVGMPVRVEEKLFNGAVVFQSGKILGIIPKTYLPNYREFQEKRWFSPSDVLFHETVRMGDEDIPIGPHILFHSGEVGFGIEICEDMWTPYTPGTRLALYGAHIIFNLSTSNENVGKNDYLRSLISGLSSQSLSGYVYASSGHGESSTDLVYMGKGFIAEIGNIIEEMDRFEYAEKMIVSDIDVMHIQNERLLNSSFKKAVSEFTQEEILKIPFKLRKKDASQPITRPIESNPFMPTGTSVRERCKEMFEIQVCGLVQRLRHMNASHAVVGISGGLDSTLALLVTATAFDRLGIARDKVVGVTMPGFGTTDRTLKNARLMMQRLGVEAREVDIRESCLLQFKNIGHDPNIKDVTYENVQARERTQILMNLSNMLGGPVVGTGDLSEIALGWSTFNGDHMSMYSVNATVTKTCVRLIIEQYAKHVADDSVLREVLLDVCDLPISPELLPAKESNGQHTESIIGPYELHDFFIYHILYGRFTPRKVFFLASIAFKDKYSLEEIKHCMKLFLKRFFAQQFKRNCMPDGPKVGMVSLSSRGEWRMPSDAESRMWLAEVDSLDTTSPL